MLLYILMLIGGFVLGASCAIRRYRSIMAQALEDWNRYHQTIVNALQGDIDAHLDTIAELKEG